MYKEELKHHIDFLFQKNKIDKTKFNEEALQLNAAVMQSKVEVIQNKLESVETYEPIFTHAQKGGRGNE